MDRIENFFSRGLRIGHLHTIVLLGQLGQVQRVAKELRTSQPAISRQLAEMEAGLGTPLTRREGQGIVFTDAGNVLLKEARRIVFHLEQAGHAFRQATGVIGGELRVGVTPSVMPSIAGRLSREVSEHAPALSLSYLEVSEEKASSMLSSGSIHLLFSRLPAELAGAQAGVGIELMYDPLVVALLDTDDVCSGALAQRRWVLPVFESSVERGVRDWMNERALVLAPGSVRSTSNDLCLELLQVGTHAAILPMSSLTRLGPLRESVSHVQLPHVPARICVHHAPPERLSAAAKFVVDRLPCLQG